MVSTALSVRLTHFERTKFRILGAREIMPSIASSVIREQAVRSNIRRCSNDRLIIRGGKSSFFVVVEVGKGFGVSCWTSGLTGAGNAASVSNEQWERRISRM